jgi:2-(1,2-epoxy-1,2-dihydrophenyl)acetyl-CoA isomerase
MADTVLYEVNDGLATITLNRPEAMNALDMATKQALLAALRTAAGEDSVRAVLFTAVGRAFCVGQDLKEHVALLTADRPNAAADERLMDTVQQHYSPIALTIATMPKPVVAGVNGVAAGAGAGFALAADYRVVSEEASFNTSFAGIALTADSGVSWTLPRLVGSARAADLLMFPRSVSARQALEWGMVQQVVPAAELPGTALEVARRLACGPTVAYAAIKESLAYGAEHSLADTLVREGDLQERAGTSQDHRTAVEAFLKKEKPDYRGR